MSSSTPPRKFKVEHIESTTKSSRKFAPKLIETTTTSSRVSDDASLVPPTKRFLPQPIETSNSSSNQRNNQSDTSSAPRKFSPQLVHSTIRSNQHGEDSDSNERASIHTTHSTTSSTSTSKPIRSFKPQLIDTAKRSRKAGDTGPAHLPSDLTDALPASMEGLRRFRRKVLEAPPPPENTPAGMISPTISSAEARRLGISMPNRQISQLVQSNARQHSFRVPGLECIDSSESDEPSSPSMSTSPSSASDMSYKHATRMRESIDASSSGYLLELAAKAAERQLREQALDAFPNDDRHTQIDHFIDRDDSTTASTRSEYGPLHFGSGTWDLKDMRHHHQKLEAKKERELAQRDGGRNRAHRASNHSLWGSPFSTSSLRKPKQNDSEMDRMRRKARPPMLGSDIEFPRCRSPSPARFDVTQGSTFLRAQMCYLTEHAEVDECKDGLWIPKEENKTTQTSMWSRSSSRTPSPGGLWGGCCRGGGFSPPSGPTGLMTPHVYDDVPNSMETAEASHLFRQLPPSPPPSNSGMANLDEKLEAEQSIEAEFTDEFVTQVYNYLSLGYPSLARKYDDELSKISRTPLSDLRHDDSLASSRGYIRLGEDECGKQDGIEEEMCARWKSLRVYIHEWARQQPKMAQQQNHQGGFGVSVRRGSWAW